MTAKSALNPVGSVWGVDATDSTSELRFLGVLGLKCTGYFQSVDLIHRRVNVVIGLVRPSSAPQIKRETNSLYSFQTGSASKARKQRTISLIRVSH